MGGNGEGGGGVVTPSRDMMELLLRAAPSLLDQFVVYVSWLQLLVSQVREKGRGSFFFPLSTESTPQLNPRHRPREGAGY